jgi:hypothetical protein
MPQHLLHTGLSGIAKTNKLKKTSNIEKWRKDEHGEELPVEGAEKKAVYGKSILSKGTILGFFKWRVKGRGL